MTDREYELIVALHKLGNDYIDVCEDPDVQKVTSRRKFKTLLKNKEFALIYKKLLARFYSKSIKNDNVNTNSMSTLPFPKELYELDTFFVKSPRIVVYSNISKGYDTIKEPNFLHPEYDYVLFTDDDKPLHIKNSAWSYRKVPSSIALLGDNIIINRYIKFHPKELFPDYDISIYIDGSIKILSDITPLIYKTIASNVGLGMHKHMFRDCVYTEAQTCINMRKGKKQGILNQMSTYEKEGFPHNYGLLEAGVLAIDLNNSLANEILNDWYEDFRTQKSMRDQLSLPYVLWKHGISHEDIAILGDDLKKNPMFKLYLHGKYS